MTTPPPIERRKRDIPIALDRRKHDEDYDRLIGGVRATRPPPSEVQDRPKRTPRKNR